MVERRSFGRWAQLRLSLGPEGGHVYDDRVLQIVLEAAEADTPWTVEDVTFLWKAADGLVSYEHSNYAELYRIPLAAIQRLDHRDRRQVLHWVPEQLEDRYPKAWDALHDQIERVLTEPPEHGPAGVVRALTWDFDLFAHVMAEEYGTRLASPTVLPLLKHWTLKGWRTTRTFKSSVKWLTQARSLLTDDAVEMIREILGRVAAHQEQTVESSGANGYVWTSKIFLDTHTEVLVRGVVWTCELIDQPWVPGLLGDVAVTCGAALYPGHGKGPYLRSELLANAAVHVLSKRDGLDTMAALARVRNEVRKKAVLIKVTRALDEVAARTGLTPEQMLDH
ncbi:hypothetical protein [Nonomuraea guangzhouensis]|uniref:Uncharacterized protein n=1 Tax=Nonomuraea guangzhouensis TaxID=1291555 RepID=A0ABW4GQB4_9ACTN|nr:hypothetical protein [Nonomuraea guangzhouensis]